METPITKEELVNLIGMAELLSERLKDIGQNFDSEMVKEAAHHLRQCFDKICGEEEFKKLRDEL